MQVDEVSFHGLTLSCCSARTGFHSLRWSAIWTSSMVTPCTASIIWEEQSNAACVLIQQISIQEKKTIIKPALTCEMRLSLVFCTWGDLSRSLFRSLSRSLSLLSVYSSSCGVERAMWVNLPRLEPPMPCWSWCWGGGWGWGCAGGTRITGGGHVVPRAGWIEVLLWGLMFKRFRLGGGGRGGGLILILASLNRRGSCWTILRAAITEGRSLACWSTLITPTVWARGRGSLKTDSRLRDIPEDAGKSLFNSQCKVEFTFVCQVKLMRGKIHKLLVLKESK